MSEFKFFCPQCGQHILCDTGYSGKQIKCPICQKAIVVPQSPAAAPVLPQAAPVYAPLPSAAPAASRSYAGAPVARPTAPVSTSAVKNILIIVAAVLLFAALGIGGWFAYSKLSFTPTYDFAGHWSDGAPESSDVHRNGKRVVYTFNNSDFEHTFTGNYIDDKTIVGVQTRRKRADGTSTRMSLTIMLSSADSAQIDWVGLDSNSDIRQGQRGTAYIRRVASPQP
jgi:hypothetical protein